MKLKRILDADVHIIERDAELFEYPGPPYAKTPTVLGYPFFPSLDGYNRGAIMALGLTDHGVVLRNGVVAFAGSAADLGSSDEVRAAYLSGSAPHTAPQ